jgi:hypothetical protein
MPEISGISTLRGGQMPEISGNLGSAPTLPGVELRGGLRRDGRSRA